mgnify:CR=1 FL=1
MELWTRLAVACGAAAIVAALLWALRRRHHVSFRLASAGGGRGRALSREERVLLTPHHSVHLVRVGARALIVAAFTGGCAVLDACSWEELQGGGKEGGR